jgi:decaprenylphospho-beta-D-ribofuranose 2-oxidase
MPEPAGERPTRLTGWGRTAPTTARLHTGTAEELPGLVAAAGPRGLIARGLGRSYGDAAQNAGGDVVAPLPSSIELDPGTEGGPVVHVSAGTSIHELIRELVPTGHFVPVTPGTRYVTVGGAIAADVHGKNHHRHGSFGSHVVSLDLVTADGSVRTVGPDQEAGLFWATVGGMGLTGVIVRATVRVYAVESGLMRVQTERLDDIDAVMGRMRETDGEATHTVAWIDTLATGRHLGRSVLTLGEHATAAEASGARGGRGQVPGDPLASAPPVVPPHLVSRPTIRAFNELWFRKAPRHREGELQSIAAFFHPLDLVGGWNRLYGPAGFVQYQLVVPDAAEGELPGMLETIARAGHPSFLSVLKRFGPGNEGMLSFPVQGWTLALDVPTHPGLAVLLRELDAVVADHGGRVYLAKDSRLAPATFARMYPRLDEFRQVLSTVDPDRVFCSDLSRRLRI